MAGAYRLWMGNTNRVEATLTDPENGDAAITDANPAITVQTVAGVGVTGQSFPLSMDHEGSGVYAADLSKDLALTEWTAYKGVIADAAKGISVDVPYVAVTRTGGDVSQERIDVIATKAGLL